MEIQKGCVYFFKHKGIDAIKIGMTNKSNPKNRFSSLKTYSPNGASIIGYIETPHFQELESLLHEKYKSKRLNGEWFDITKEDCINEINYFRFVSKQHIVELKKIYNKKDIIIKKRKRRCVVYSKKLKLLVKFYLVCFEFDMLKHEILKHTNIDFNSNPFNKC
jgi:hypothetical protein